MRLGLIALIIIVVAVVAVFVLFAFGLINIPGLSDGLFGEPEKNHPDATYCDYTEMQILDMLEIAAGKDLENQRGVSYVRALDMTACGIDNQNPSSLMSYYINENSDWYTYYNDQTSGAGYTVQIIIWTNSPSAGNSTLAKSVVVVDGITVEEAYGYDSLVLTSNGTVLTYAAFLNWVNTS